MTSVLLLTRDPVLAADVRRLVVVAGADPCEATSAAQARRTWRSAAAVVVGDDLLAEAAGAGLERRDGVAVVSRARDALCWDAALALGADAVLELPSDERLLLLRLADAALGQVRPARCVGVLGAAGGAGASVLSVALGLAVARRGASAVVVDADPGSPGLDLLLAAEDDRGARWGDLVGVSGQLDPETLRAALPVGHRAGGAVGRPRGRRGGPARRARRRPRLRAQRVRRRPLRPPARPPRGARPRRAALRRAAARGHHRRPRRHRRSPRGRGARARGRRCGSSCAGGGGPRSSPSRSRRGSAREMAAEIDDEPGLTASVDRGRPPGERGRLGRTCDQLAATLLAPA